MAAPQVKLIAVSNVFSRLMRFVSAGDVEVGHCHNYDHATLISSGAVRYEVLDGLDGAVIHQKDFVAPAFVFVEKDKYHRLTALEPDTVCACIHALRTIDGDLVSPDTLIRPVAGGQGQIDAAVRNVFDKPMQPFCKKLEA